MAELNFSLEKVYWKKEVQVDITPTTEPQTVTPEAGQAFNKVNVSAIPAPALQDKVVTPTEQTQNVRADAGYDGLDEVQVDPIPPEYVVPAGTENITANGDYNIADKASAHVAVEPVLENKTVTPTEQTQTVEADTGYDGLDTVTVKPIPSEYVVPSGNVDITANGQVSVSGKATANVNVPQGVFPSGTKLITENVTGEDVTNYAAVDVAVSGPSGTKRISITQNGTTTENVSEYEDAENTVNTLPEKGLVFEDYDSDGSARQARFIGDWTTIPAYFIRDIFNKASLEIPSNCTEIGRAAFYLAAWLKKVVIPSSVTVIPNSCFSDCSSLEEVIVKADNVLVDQYCFDNCTKLSKIVFEGQVSQIGSSAFPDTTNILFDFSNCSTVPVLSSTTAIGNVNTVTFRIPAILESAWKQATNWIVYTNVTWEVVQDA